MDLLSPYIPHPSFINVLPSASILGLSLDIILYLVVAITLILFLFRKITKKILTQVVFGAWLVISLLFLIQSGIQTSTESQLFGGESLDELRDSTTANGFYSFLTFANQNIPAESSVSLSVPGEYFSFKAPYYLYPHQIIPDGEYQLVFQTAFDFDEEKFVVFKEFKKNEYILKKK